MIKKLSSVNFCCTYKPSVKPDPAWIGLFLEFWLRVGVVIGLGAMKFEARSGEIRRARTKWGSWGGGSQPPSH